MKTSIPVWVVAYKPVKESGWQIKRNLDGPGHATDIVNQMLTGGFIQALPVCAQLVIVFDETIGCTESSKLDPPETGTALQKPEKPAKQPKGKS